MQQWFSAHPQLGYVSGGIAGYSSAWEIARQAVIADEPLWRITSAELLSMPHSDSGLPLVDMTHARAPMRAPQEQVCDLLKGLFPTASVLIVVRGFASMVLSAYSQFVRTGGRLALDEFCERGVGAVAIEEGWNYDTVVGIYRSRFGADSVLVMPYELLRDDAARFVRVLEDWLGLDPEPADTHAVNASLSAIEMAWYPRLTKAVHALPLPRRVARRVQLRYLAGAEANRYAALVARLQRLRPQPPVTLRPLGDIAELFAGRSKCLREDPLFAPYASDYLFERPD